MDTDALEKELVQLPHLARAAFAAACGERMLLVYKYTCSGDIVRRGPRLAVKAAWRVASGEAVESDVLQLAKTEVDKAFPKPDLGGGADHFAVASAAYAFDSITDTTCGSATSAALNALDALDQADEEGAVEEEEAWQDRLLQAVKDHVKTGKPMQRDAFEALLSEKPITWTASNDLERWLVLTTQALIKI